MQTTFGRYEIIKELDRGGMATVYLARDPLFQRTVALKVLPREFLHSPTFQARFEQEARTIAALEHPAIVPVYDVGKEAGQPYLVMRYMAGGSLADRLAAGPLSLATAVPIVQRLAAALDEAHALGIVHRDLKPENVLFDQRDEAYLVDFGIARPAESSAHLTGSMIIGTPAYMSPEQAGGTQTIDGRSDVYALGALLYRMLTGRNPYPADTPIQQAVKHITAPIPDILDERSDLPLGLASIMSRALAKDPTDRYPTAGELAADLLLLAGDPAHRPEPYQPTEMLAGVAATPAPLAAKGPVPSAPTSGHSIPALPVWAWGGVVFLLVFILLGLWRNDVVLPGSPTPTASPTPLPTNTPPPRTVIITPDPPTPTVPVIVRPGDIPAVQLLQTLPGHTDFINSLSWSPAGRLAAGDRSGEVIIWNGASGRVENRFPAHVSSVQAVAFSPAGDRLATAGEDGLVLIWDADGKNRLLEIAPGGGAVGGAESRINSVAWSPDGSRFVTGDDAGDVHIWAADTGRKLLTLEGHTDGVLAVAWSPDSTLLASAGNDETVRLWDVTGGGQITLLIGHTGPVTSIAFRPDGRQLASGGADGTLRVWDMAGGSQIHALAGHTRAVNGVAWSPDGALLATAGGDETVRLWLAAAGQEAHSLAGHSAPVFSVAWSLDGALLASAGRDGEIKLWGIGN